MIVLDCRLTFIVQYVGRNTSCRVCASWLREVRGICPMLYQIIEARTLVARMSNMRPLIETAWRLSVGDEGDEEPTETADAQVQASVQTHPLPSALKMEELLSVLYTWDAHRNTKQPIFSTSAVPPFWKVP